MKTAATHGPRKSGKGHPALAGIVVGLIVSAVAILLLVGLPSLEHRPRAETPAPAQDSVAPEASPAAGIAYNGMLVARTEWIDSEGSHVVVLSKTDSTLEARHFRSAQGGPFLVAEHVAAVPANAAAAGFYRDGVWASDMAGNGNEEAMFAYYVDPDAEPGPKQLVLVVFAGDRELSIRGSTRYDPATGQRIPAVTHIDEAVAAAPSGIQAQAAGLWSEAQFDLAEPAPFPGFSGVLRLDGAQFHGEGPAWSMVVLPQYMLFKYATAQDYSVIKYASITTQDGSIVFEGSGDVESWNHKFRITVTEGAATAPNGTTYPYAMTVDWSDGTRLQGWGGPAPSS